MNNLKSLFEYQRFAGNKRLQRILDDTAKRCLPQGEKLDDAWLDVAAAGEPESWRDVPGTAPGKENTDGQRKS